MSKIASTVDAIYGITPLPAQMRVDLLIILRGKRLRDTVWYGVLMPGALVLVALLTHAFSPLWLPLAAAAFCEYVGVREARYAYLYHRKLREQRMQDGQSA